MRITADNLNKIINKYKNDIINHRIVDYELINSRMFLLTLDKTNKKIIIDLDNSNPYFGVLDITFKGVSLPSNFIAKLKQKGQPRIIDISSVNNDRIIKITTTATDAFYHKLNFFLYIELINSHANMILTDDKDKILAAFYETSINSPRLIISNNKYMLPEKKELLITNDTFNISEYDKFINDSYNKGIDKRKNEIFHNQIKEFKKKEKNILKKLSFSIKNLENAKDADVYKENGNMILIYKDQIKIGDEEFNGIKLDKTKNAIDNANTYFNKYKKLKRSVDIINNLIISLNKELEDVRYKASIIEIGDEKDINTIINNKNKKNESSPSYFPYLIKYKNLNIYYGVNKFENDYLTFKMFNQNSKAIWLHLNNVSSAHMIINTDVIDDSDLEIICSLYLLINKKTIGEIMIVNRKDITRSNAIGEVNIKNYKIIKLNKINENANKLLKNSKKYKSN